MAHQNKPEGVPVPTVVISVIAVFVAGLLIGGFALRFGSKGKQDCDECAAGAAGASAEASGVKRYRIYPRPHNASIGPKAAKVTIVEVSDFQCPYCKRGSGTVKQILKAFPRDVRVVFMNNPLPMHKDARLAAVAAQAAHKQGKFWQMHDIMFKNSHKLKKPQLLAYAKQIGLDVAKFTKDIENRRLQVQVTQDMQQLRRLGARGTPAFFVNGRYVRGAKPFSYFKKLIQSEIRYANKQLKSGVALAQLYRHIMKTAEFKIGGKGNTRKGKGKRRPPREDPNAVYKISLDGRPYKGAKNAKVTIVEWSDFQCPWCKRVTPTIKAVMKKFPKDVKVVWYDFPLRFHKSAMPAAIACHEVFKQKGNAAFWKCHDKVFENNKNITDENLAKWATEIGANGKAVLAAIKSKKHEAAIRASARVGQTIGVRGTPTVVVNGKKYRGRRDPATMIKFVEAEIAKANAIIGKGGVTLATYYAHIQKKGLTRVKYLPGQAGGRGAKGRRPKRRQLDPNAIYKVTLDGKSPSKGPKHALVTVVEWSDFQCPYCKWAACVAKQIHQAYPKQVRIVFKNNPLGFHRQAMPAAEAAMAAFAQKGNKGFWAMHDKIYPTDKCKPNMPQIREWLRALPRPAPKMDIALFEKYAAAIGINAARMKADIEKHVNQARIKAEQAQAAKLGARGTPAFFINGKYIRGVRPFPRMKQIIDAEIAKAKKLMADKKIPLAKVYSTIIASGATAPVYLSPGKGGRPNVRVRPGGHPGRPGARRIRLKPMGH